MAVQVTIFPNNIGFSIGTAFNHGVVDAKSETMFLKAWAFFCKLDQPPVPDSIVSLPPELTPIFDRNVIVNPFELDFHGNGLKFSTHYDSISNWLRATFELTGSDIKKLKKRAMDHHQASPLKEFHLSTFVVTYAYVLVCLAKAAKVGAEEKLYLSISADLRGRSEPPIPTKYFGNCVGGCGVYAKAREIIEDHEDEDGFAKIAKRIGDQIRELNKQKDLQSAVKIFISEAIIASRSGARVTTVASSPKFKVYETDFGWGKPKSIEFVLLGQRTIAITDAKNGGEGVEVGIVLPSDQMDLFASVFSTGLKN